MKRLAQAGQRVGNIAKGASTRPDSIIAAIRAPIVMSPLWIR